MQSHRIRASEIPAPVRKELEYLYSRRSALDALIRSLEQYARFRQRSNQRRTRENVVITG
jgi:hypothetical protein